MTLRQILFEPYCLPVYSGMEADEIVEPFSQSFSPLWPLIRLGDMNREGECERLGGVKKGYSSLLCGHVDVQIKEKKKKAKLVLPALLLH